MRYEVERIELDRLPKLPVKIMMNVASPERAFALAQLPHNGVGLARVEFIIGNTIGIHPQVKGRGAEAFGLGHHPREEGQKAHPEVAGELVDPGGDPAAVRGHQVHHHVHGHAPGQGLVHPQEDVGGRHHVPGGGKDEEEGHRHPEGPAQKQHAPPSHAVGQRPGEEVEEGLGEPKGEDEPA